MLKCRTNLYFDQLATFADDQMYGTVPVTRFDPAIQQRDMIDRCRYCGDGAILLRQIVDDDPATGDILHLRQPDRFTVEFIDNRAR